MKLTDKDIMPFGCWKGKALANVPDSYLLWLYNEGCKNLDLRAYIEDNLPAIRLGLRNGKG